jgi:acetolactate synthase-1/2/3 large subunit
MKKLMSEQIVKYLADRGVEHIFGLCGHTNIAFLAALSKSNKIKFINVRHEQIASHAADGYARVTRKASVVLSTLGPGIANNVTGVATAALDSIPMVVIAGDVQSYYFGKHPHQEVNLHADGSQCEIFRPFVKRVWRVDRAELFPEILEKAFSMAESGRPGPVVIDVPMDMFSTEVDEVLFKRLSYNTKTIEKPSIDEDLAERVLKEIAGAKNPVIHVGGGVKLSGATKEFEEFVNHMGIPVSCTLMGKATLPDTNPLMMGMTGFWGTKFINEKCRNADYILALGTSFKECDSSSWDPDYTFSGPPTKLIHIDIDPTEIGRNYPVEIGVVADLKKALTVLNKVAKKFYPTPRKNEAVEQEIARWKKEFKESNQALEESNQFPMSPQRILADLRSAAPADALIVTDVGWNKNGIGQQFSFYTADTFITPGGLATMGFGVPGAMGVKIGAPDKTVIAVVGDGGFGQNPAVLASIAAENVPIVIVIMNNNAYGTIAGLIKAHYGTTFGTVFSRNGEEYAPDYAGIARNYGIDGVSIQKAEDFKPELEKAIKANKPVVLDVRMVNIPTPTEGHWDIMNVFSPGKKVHHVSTH